MKKSKVIEKGSIRRSFANTLLPFSIEKQELSNLFGGETCGGVLRECKSPPGKTICKGGFSALCALFTCSSKYITHLTGNEWSFQV